MADDNSLDKDNSFYYYVANVIDKAIADEFDGHDFIRQISPLIVCKEVGHYKQPKVFLGRFRRRPWRCSRCCTWWRTYNYETFGGGFTGWVFLGTDGTVPAVRRTV